MIKWLLNLVVLIVFASPASLLAQQIEIKISSFIPNDHPTNPGYVRPVPAPIGTEECDEDDDLCNTPLPEFMIPGPGIPYFSSNPLPLVGSCYNTNDRGFEPYSNNSKAETRVWFGHSNGILNDLSVRHKTGRSIRLDCKTAVVECSEKVATDNITAKPEVIGNHIKIKVSGNVANPCAPVWESITPSIKWSGEFDIDTQAKTVRYQGSVAGFPSYEAYIMVDSEEPVPIFQLSPNPGSTVWSLVSTRDVDVTVQYKTTPPKPRDVQQQDPQPESQPQQNPALSILGSWKTQIGNMAMKWTFHSNGKVEEWRSNGSTTSTVWGKWSLNSTNGRVQFGTSRIFDIELSATRVTATGVPSGTVRVWKR